MADDGVRSRMRRTVGLLATGLLSIALIFMAAPGALACEFSTCPTTELEDGGANVAFSGARVATLAGSDPQQQADYAWRLTSLCVLADEQVGTCSPLDFRPCAQEPGRVIQYLVLQKRPVVRPDGTAVVPVPPGAQIGDHLADWEDVREGCIDITSLNPPPSPAEVFSFFQRLPLPELATQHQPPGDGLSGLPVIFYTDSPTTQTFTVDIRGFAVVIEAVAQSYTWHTGDPREPTLTSDDPGRPYPDQTIEHSYVSGSYTAHLTVTWGATYSVDGGAAAEVPGTTTTDGPPVSFDVLQARPVLTNPYD